MNERRLVEFEESKGRSSPWIGRIGKGFIGLIISAAFIVLTLRGVNLTQVKTHLREMDLKMLLPIFISLSVIFLLKAIRWWYLLFPLKRIGFSRIFSTTVIGFMANNALPLRSGDLVRAHLLGRREDVGTTAIFATVALDRVFEVFSLITVSVVVLFIVPLPKWIWESVVILGIALLALIMGITAFRSPPGLLVRWWKTLLGILPDKLKETLSKSIKQIRFGLEAGSGKARLINLYILAVGESAVTGLLVYYSLKMMGVELSLVVIMSVIIAMNLAVLVPAAPANIGVFEFAVMTTLEFFQFNRNIALSGAVVLHAISIIPVSLVGMILFMREWLVPRKGAF